MIGIFSMQNQSNTRKQAVIDLVRDASLEVTPAGAAKIAEFAEIVRNGCTIYVTFLPGSDFAETIRTVRRLKAEGYNAIPHFAARSIPSAKYLEENLAVLQGEIGVTEGLLIGGGVDSPVGDFDASIEVIRTGLFEKYGFTKLGVAGHPEGSPDISEADCNLAVKQKNDYAKNTDMTLYLATQFVFEAGPLVAWERKIREEGNNLHICVGIPGLASIKTLLNYARECGAGPSVRFLTRRPIDIFRLSLQQSFLGRYSSAPSAEPSQLLCDLAGARESDPGCLIRRCHIYPLGGLKKSAKWIYEVQDGNFQFSGRGFDLVSKL